MGANSAIQWTEATWNPVVGCSILSPGCHACYAMTMGNRLRSMALADIKEGRNPGRKRHYIDAVDDDGRWTGKLVPVPEALDDPLHWKAPRMVFVNSMSDLFHENVPFDFVAGVFGTMAATQRHTYQVLTKRAERMREWFDWLPSHYNGPRRTDLEAQASELRRKVYREAPDVPFPIPNLWLGVSVEDQKRASRVEHLFRTPAAVRWVSYEPCLGPVDFRPYLHDSTCEYSPCICSEPREVHLDWIVIGVESSGPRVGRLGEFKSEAEWIENAVSVVRQCQAANVSCFVKQIPSGGRVEHDMAKFPEPLRVRQFPERKEAATCS